MLGLPFSSASTEDADVIALDWTFEQAEVFRYGKALSHCRNAPLTGHLVNGLPVLPAVISLQNNPKVYSGCTLMAHAGTKFVVSDPSGVLIEFGCRLQGHITKNATYGNGWAEGVLTLQADWMKHGPWRCKKSAGDLMEGQPERMEIPFAKNDTTVGCIPSGTYEASVKLLLRASMMGGKGEAGAVIIDLAKSDEFGFTAILMFHGECQYQP